jgi:hypothetical protein
MDVTNSVNKSIETINAWREAETAKLEADRMNAPEEVRQAYDQYLGELKTESVKYQNEIIQQMNEYNIQNTATLQERIDNVMQLSQQYRDAQTPLTEDEMKMVDSFAQFAVGKDGQINEALMKSVPPKMFGAVLARAAELK